MPKSRVAAVGLARKRMPIAAMATQARTAKAMAAVVRLLRLAEDAVV
jgi:hypothetical protein